VGNQWRVDKDALMAWVKEEGQPSKAVLSPEGEAKP